MLTVFKYLKHVLRKRENGLEKAANNEIKYRKVKWIPWTWALIRLVSLDCQGRDGLALFVHKW